MYKNSKAQLSFPRLNRNPTLKIYKKNILNLFLFREILFSMTHISSLHMFMMSLSKHMISLQK
jgi:hypothetical protein